MSKGFYFTFLSALTWAVSIVLARILLNAGENAYNLAFWTVLLESLFWAFVLTRNLPELKTTGKSNGLLLIGIGLISTVGVSVVEALALKYSPAVNYAFLIRSVILFTIIFAYLFLGEKLTRKKIILAVLILAGAYLLTTRGKLIYFSVGDLFTLLEAALIAFGNNVLGKLATNKMSVDLSASASFLIGVIPICLIALFNNAVRFPKSPMLMALLTIFYILITLTRYRAYKNATASYVTMVFSFTPVFVSLMAVPFLKETLTPVQLIGGGLIILAGISVEKLKI